MPLERDAILGAINDTSNITEAAKQLGASRRTLQLRMRHYAIPPGKGGRPREALPYNHVSRAHPHALSRAGEQLALLGILGGVLLLGNWLLKAPSSIVGGDLRARDLRGLDVVLGR